MPIALAAVPHDIEFVLSPVTVPTAYFTVVPSFQKAIVLFAVESYSIANAVLGELDPADEDALPQVKAEPEFANTIPLILSLSSSSSNI